MICELLIKLTQVVHTGYKLYLYERLMKTEEEKTYKVTFVHWTHLFYLE